MGLVSKPNTYVAGQTIVASQVNANEDTLYALVNGNLENDNVKSGAAIAASKINFGSDIWVRSVISLSSGDIYAGTGKDEFTVPATIPTGKWVIETVEVEVDTAPGTGKTLTIDVNKGGTTILSAPISIATAAILSTGNTPSVTALSAGDRMTLDIDTATAGIATYRVRVNLVIKQYLQAA